MTMDQFCELCDKSPNFKMVQNLVQRLKQVSHPNINKTYAKFIETIGTHYM